MLMQTSKAVGALSPPLMQSIKKTKKLKIEEKRPRDL